jgi:hypothetical protein
MRARVKKQHPALKHGGFCVTGILPGEKPADFNRLYRGLIAELSPEGPLENDTVEQICLLLWRKRNRRTIGEAVAARARYSSIISKHVPESMPFFETTFGQVDPNWTPPDPADVKAGLEAATAEAQKELGFAGYLLAKMGDAATTSRMFEDFGVDERLDAMIDKLLKRLWAFKAFKSLHASSRTAPLPRLPAPKGAWISLVRQSRKIDDCDLK